MTACSRSSGNAEVRPRHERRAQLVAWLVPEGAEVAVGDEVAEVETDKINGAVEAPAAGVLRRQVAKVGDVVPVGGLLGVLADAAAADDEIDAFVAEFQASFVPEEADEDAGPPTETVTAARPRAALPAPRRRQRDRGARPRLRRRPDDLAVQRGGPGRPAVGLRVRPSRSRRLLEGRRSRRRWPSSPGPCSASLDALGIERAHLVGHSLGGAVAATLAAEHPERVASLTLIAPAGLGEEINGEFIDGFVAAESRRELKGVLERLFADPGS